MCVCVRERERERGLVPLSLVPYSKAYTLLVNIITFLLNKERESTFRDTDFLVMPPCIYETSSFRMYLGILPLFASRKWINMLHNYSFANLLKDGTLLAYKCGNAHGLRAQSLRVLLGYYKSLHKYKKMRSYLRSSKGHCKGVIRVHTNQY